MLQRILLNTLRTVEEYGDYRRKQMGDANEGEISISNN
jgi:hypothetical protein